MKTLMTAALFAALALTSFARGDEPASEPTPVKKTAEVKKLTIDQLRAMLEQMGYEAKPVKLKDGKVIGYDITMDHSGLTVYCRLEMSDSGQLIWLYGTLARTADTSTPAEVLLAMLAVNLDISPASINYNPKSKKFEVLLTLTNESVTPVKLRAALNAFANGIKQALDTFDKATAKAKPQQVGKPEANSLP